MEEMQVTSDLTWIEVQFAKKAVDEVIKCRNTLQWTYAMAYYLVGNRIVALSGRLLIALCLVGERYIPTVLTRVIN
jgi:hypothetical protein